MSAASSKVTEDDMDNNTRQVLRQIEYYFSDANYPKDKFLQAEVAKSEDGWVDISVLAGFNRIKTLVPSQEVSAVADILKLSNHLELSEDGARVRRPGIVKKSVKLGGMEFKSRDEVVSYARQLIAEGDAATDGAIPTEGQEFVKALLDLHDKAAEKRGDGVERIKVGRNPDFPDTSCFVVARVDGSEVDFSYLKCLEKIFPVLGRGAGAGAGAGGKKRAGGGSNDSSSKRPKTEESAPAPVEYESGKIVVLKSLPEGFDRFTLRDKLGGPDAGCNFVEMVPGVALAYARFASPAQAQAALAIEGVGEPALLEGNDEQQYWEKIAAGGAGRGGGGGGKGGGRGKGGGKGGKGKGKGKGGKGKGGGKKGGRGS